LKKKKKREREREREEAMRDLRETTASAAAAGGSKVDREEDGGDRRYVHGSWVTSTSSHCLLVRLQPLPQFPHLSPRRL
jgi:hypothetical protein